MTSSQNPVVANSNSHGLANRIKCLLSALHLNPNAKNCWPKKQKGIPFEDLFLFHNNIEINEITPDSKILTSWQFLILESDELTDFSSELSFVHLPTWRKAKRIGPHVDNLYEKMPLNLQSIYFSLMERLVPNPSIQQVILEAGNVFEQCKIAIHIRTWPASLVGFNIRAILFNSRDIYKIIREAKNQKVFIACDNRRYLDHLKEKFPENIFTIHDLNSYSKLTSKHQADLADMLLLGTFPKLYAAEGSTFSEISWLYSKGKSQITIIKTSLWRKYFFILVYSVLTSLLTQRMRVKLKIWI